MEMIYKIIKSPDLFSLVGEKCKIENHIMVDSENMAFLQWKNQSFSDARTIAWEAMRIKILSDSNKTELWTAEFRKISTMALETITQISSICSLLLKHNVDIKEFIQDLPFVGAAGEAIAFESDHAKCFFRAQLPVFSKGHWVCGWRGSAMIDQGIYPKNDFFVY